MISEAVCHIMLRITTEINGSKHVPGTASSNSKARISVNSRAFILRERDRDNLNWSDNYDGFEKNLETYSTSENRNPIHARGPPRNVSIFPQTPGMLLAVSGIESHRSGLS